jgi:hypothetical protein
MYGVNFNLAKIKLPTFGKLSIIISNKYSIRAQLDGCTFDSVSLKVFLVEPNYTETFITSVNSTSYNYNIDPDITYEDLKYLKSCYLKIVAEGITSLFRKQLTYSVSIGTLQVYILPSVDLVCSPVLLCKGVE